MCACVWGIKCVCVCVRARTRVSAGLDGRNGADLASVLWPAAGAASSSPMAALKTQRSIGAHPGGATLLTRDLTHPLLQASLRDWDSGAHYAAKQSKLAAQRFRAREYEQRISREQVRVCVCVPMRACVCAHACVRACVRACVCACVCLCLGVNVGVWVWMCEGWGGKRVEQGEVGVGN